MSALTPIPTGALFTVSTGEYSDYHIKGVFRAKAEIEPDKLCAVWFARHPEQRERYRFRDDQFLSWVATLDLIEPVECWEWHLADYHDAEEMTVAIMTDRDQDDPED